MFLHHFLLHLFIVNYCFRKEAHQATSQKEREGIRKWQQKLQEWEERLSSSREFLDDKEQKVSENSTIMKQKEKDLEEMKKKTDLSSSVLKEREDDVNRQLADVEAKEKVKTNKMSHFYSPPPLNCGYVYELFCIPFPQQIWLQEAGFSRRVLEKKEEELHQMEKNLRGREMVSQTLCFCFCW